MSYCRGKLITGQAFLLANSCLVTFFCWRWVTMGRIATLVTQTAEALTPLMRELSRLARALAAVVVLFVSALFIGGTLASSQLRDVRDERRVRCRRCS